MKVLKSMVFAFLISGGVSGVGLLANAAEFHCDVCGMTIPEKARNHFMLKSQASKEPLHVCSLTCLRKARKHDSTLTDVEISDFNDPEKSLPGNQAFFLLKSQKIKADMGEKAMAPYAAAFATKEEALAAQKKYGDGQVVHGLNEAFK